MRHSNIGMTMAIHAPHPKPGHLWPDDPLIKYMDAQLKMATRRYMHARNFHIEQQGTYYSEQSRLVMNYRYRLYQDALARMNALEAIVDRETIRRA